MKKIIALLLALCLLLAGCAGEEAADPNATKLSFKDALSYDYLASLNGATVTINGYLATSSPVDGSFIFLMNMPYQNCPFCIPNTNQLSNTIEVYPKDGKTFSYTNQAVKVTGTLEVAPEGEMFSDSYGYTFAFKIVDGSYTILKDKDMSEEIKLWQKFSATDLVQRLDKMYQYVGFLTHWNTYSVQSYTDANGKTWPGYYLNPNDALAALGKEGAYNYGTKANYFSDIIKDIEKLDKTAFADLVENVKQAEKLSQEAKLSLLNGEYTGEKKYLEEFNNTDMVYTLNRQGELQNRMNTLYGEFANWLASWEM